VAPEPLLDELAALLGSRQEATWVLEEAAAHDGDAATVARAMAQRRASGEPLQYVLGHWPFRALDLVVDRRALIPRPETEVLVGLALDRLAARRRPVGVAAVVVDLGCGTGAIALSVGTEAPARGVAVEVHATDVARSALELAAHNAARVGAELSFHLGSWYEALPASLHGRVDVLCSNPPYVAARDRASLARELDFEPEVALVAADASDGTPGLAAVAAVVEDAPRWLAPGGVLLVEHGDVQGDGAVSLAEAAGLVEVRDHHDLAGRPRVLEAHRAP
jgi:release factor glutamine methyltransferase